MAAIKSEVEDMKAKTSEETLTQEIKRLIDEAPAKGSAAVRGFCSSAQRRTD